MDGDVRFQNTLRKDCIKVYSDQNEKGVIFLADWIVFVFHIYLAKKHCQWLETVLFTQPNPDYTCN